MLFRSPAAYGAIEYDKVSIVHVALAFAVAALWTALAALDAQGRLPRRNLARLAAFAGIAGGVSANLLISAGDAVLREAAVHGDWDTARRKAEQLVNLVEGRRGQFYADHNGDGRIEDPGDGTGFLPYTWATLTQTQFIYATATDEAYAKSAQAVQIPTTFAMLSAGFIRDVGREVARSKDGYTIQDLAGHLVTASSYMVASVETGSDLDLLAILEDREMVPVTARAQGLVRMDLAEVAR